MWTLTTRAEARVERQRFDTVERALAELTARVTELSDQATARPADVKLRRYGPKEQVVARVELAGPERRFATVHAGVDVRGDGSTEAYLGRVRKRALDRAPTDDLATALRRAIPDQGPEQGLDEG